MKSFSIELDCQPGSPRPGELLPGVLEGTGIEIDPDEPDGTLFGNWTWNIPEQFEELFETHRETIKERISKLYNNGLIRYGSW